MPAYVVVQLANRKTRGRSPKAGSHALSQALAKRVLAQHDAVLLDAPASSARDVSSGATISVPDMARAQKLATALRELDGVETAYAKPGEELP